jgi:hypothetical protein
MTSPHCLRCSTTRHHLIAVTNTANRARFNLCGPCLSATVKAMKPASRRLVEGEIVKQSAVAS